MHANTEVVLVEHSLWDRRKRKRYLCGKVQGKRAKVKTSGARSQGRGSKEEKIRGGIGGWPDETRRNLQKEKKKV